MSFNEYLEKVIDSAQVRKNAENNLTKILKDLELRFTSGNTCEVQSARLTRDEWLLIKVHLEYMRDGGCEQ